MIVMLVVGIPLMAAAGATLAAASITDAIGDTLHSLLTQGFHPFHLAAVLVFFGPIWTVLCVCARAHVRLCLRVHVHLHVHVRVHRIRSMHRMLQC